MKLSYKGDNNSGLNFLEGLGLLFIGLKLANNIDWSWYLVLLPIYGPWIFMILTLLWALWKDNK